VGGPGLLLLLKGLQKCEAMTERSNTRRLAGGGSNLEPRFQRFEKKTSERRHGAGGTSVELSRLRLRGANEHMKSYLKRIKDAGEKELAEFRAGQKRWPVNPGGL